jgi:hypothetical protein
MNFHLPLFGPVARGPAEGKRLDHSQFLIDWKQQQATCPVGCQSERWSLSHDRHGKETIRDQLLLFACM